MASGKFALGVFTDGRISGAQMLSMATPIRADDGSLTGAVIGALELKWLGQRLQDREFAASNAVTIADRKGVILAREPQLENFVGTKILDAYQYPVHAAKPRTMELTSQDGTRRIVGYIPADVPPLGLYVSAGISTVEAYRDIDRNTYVRIAITVLSLLGAYLVAALTSSQLVRRPVGRLVKAIGAWREGDVAHGLEWTARMESSDWSPGGR